MAPEIIKAAQQRAAGRDSTRLCLGIGIVLLLIGVALLLYPTTGEFEVGGRAIVNLQMLYLGQTSAILGGMFVAVAIRPR